jgi:hypothetical protein
MLQQHVRVPGFVVAPAVDAASSAALISPAVARRAARTLMADSGAATTGTRITIPSKRPLSSGMARMSAIAAPVDAGTMLTAAARPRRRSAPRAGESTRLWVAVLQEPDAVVPDDERGSPVGLDGDGWRVSPLHRVGAEQVGEAHGVGHVVHRYHLELGPRARRLEERAPAPQPVDRHPRHRVLLRRVAVVRSES